MPGEPEVVRNVIDNQCDNTVTLCEIFLSLLQ